MIKYRTFAGRIIPFLFLLILLIPGKVISQDFVPPEMTGFRKELNYPLYTPDNLWDYINGAADSYNALGFKELYIAEYKKGRKITIKLEVYRHSDDNMAFGIYSLERSPSYDFFEIGVQGYREESLVNFYTGKYYVKIITHSRSRKAADALLELARLVEKSLDGTDSFPQPLSLFPSKGKLLNEEMYISENVMGHQFLSDAFKANYNLDGRYFSIYIFTFGGADKIEDMVGRYLARLDMEPASFSEGKAAFTDGYNGYMYLAWRNDKMILISGLGKSDALQADEYINLILK